MPDAGLTPREREVVELVAHGLEDREIAARLLMSVHTVRTHLRHVRAKTGPTNRVELARLWELGRL